MEEPYEYEIDAALTSLSSRAVMSKDRNMKRWVRNLALALACRGYELTDDVMQWLDIEQPNESGKLI